MITQSSLHEVLHYDQFTGIFTWLKDGKGRKAGEIAGRENKGYIQIKLFGESYQAHRLAWFYITGNWPSKHIDHINGVKICNILSNLRECTDSQNQFNTGARSDNTSGFKGVTWNKAGNKWQAQAKLNGKNHYLGLFDTQKAASETYQSFAKANHGDFFRTTA